LSEVFLISLKLFALRSEFRYPLMTKMRAPGPIDQGTEQQADREVAVAMGLDNLAVRKAQSGDAERQANLDARQPYEAPRLARYGSVAELTAIKSVGAADASNRPFH
jgi:hypothetical protein